MRIPRPRRATPALTRTTEPLSLHVLPVDLARGAQTYAEALSRTLDGDLGTHRTMTIFQSDPVALHADIELGAKPGWGRERDSMPRPPGNSGVRSNGSNRTS